MRAIVYESPGVIALRNVPEPTLQQPEDALVKVSLAGICGTDLHAIAGHFDGMQSGAVVGHEFVGTVVETGPAVRSHSVGDLVMASDFTSCGHCRWCARSDHWHCEHRAFFGTGSSFGQPLAGAQAEFVRVPHADTTLARVPQSCSPEAAILIGDNLATGWAAIERANVRPGDIVAILGGGAVGQLASLCAQSVGAGAVVVIEPNTTRRDFAQRNGALAASPQDCAQLIARLTDGDGADAVIEAVGSANVLSAAFDHVRNRGTILSVGAHPDATWPMPLAASFSREITLSFAIGDSIRLRPQLLRMVQTGVLDPTVVVESTVGFDAVKTTYEDLKAQRIIKAVIDPAL